MPSLKYMIQLNKIPENAMPELSKIRCMKLEMKFIGHKI